MWGSLVNLIAQARGDNWELVGCLGLYWLMVGCRRKTELAVEHKEEVARARGARTQAGRRQAFVSGGKAGGDDGFGTRLRG